MKIKTKKHKKSKGGMLGRMVNRLRGNPTTSQQTIAEQIKEEEIEKDLLSKNFKDKKILYKELIPNVDVDKYIDYMNDLEDNEELYYDMTIPNDEINIDVKLIDYNKKLYYYISPLPLVGGMQQLQPEQPQTPQETDEQPIFLMNYLTYYEYFMLKKAEFTKKSNSVILVNQVGRFNETNMGMYDNRMWYFYIKINDSNGTKEYCINKIRIKKDSNPYSADSDSSLIGSILPKK